MDLRSLLNKSLSVDKNATVCWQPLGLEELMMKERMKNEGGRSLYIKSC